MGWQPGGRPVELARMDEARFAEVEAEFRAFHRIFGPFFGRRAAERRGEQYLRGLLVQRGGRRDAENLAQAVAGGAGRLPGDGATGDCGYGEVPSFRDALDAEGWRYVLEVPSNTLVFPAPARAAVPAWSGKGRKPTRPRLAEGEAPPLTVAAVAGGLA